MRLRQLAILCLICLGCQSMTANDQPAPAPREEQAQALWQQGQQAMQAGEPEQAIALYEQSLAENGRLQQNHLSLAAALLEKGDDSAACEHLQLYLQVHPEHKNARFYHAELLAKLGRHAAAHGEFELAVRQEQEASAPDLKHLVHCHSRLLEIGEELGEDYLVHLHRGIGMLLLAQQCAALDDAAAATTEALLCKAIAALQRARSLRPEEARPCWYLHAAWRQLAQPQPARRWLVAARRHAPFSELTPAEARDLWLAAGELLDPRPR